ncbi:hypothetical protein GCM10023217_14800 [Gordonia alkaliphila]|uniref:Helix-hairpin-helix DNA-binding motif class 1 domain-containing protein n=1 Tax=Gordonia alkaliphila TaxID=1053547 RepID=A0ABP8Z4F5_9ACTN
MLPRPHLVPGPRTEPGESSARRAADEQSAGEWGAEEWGATAIPAWLDTPAGRRAWAGRGDVDPGEGDLDPADDVDAHDFDRDGLRDGDRRADDVGDGDPGGEEFDDRSFDDRDLDDGDFDDEDFDDEDFDDDWGAAPKRRLTMLPPAALALIGIGMIACVIAGFTLLRNTEPAAPLVNFPASAGPTPTAESGGSPGAEGGPSASSAPSSAAATEIVVSVAGLVHKPGLVRLAPNSRVAQALEQAGGTRAQADVLSLNLAQILHDGDQVLVGTRDPAVGSVRSAVVSSGAGPVAGDGATAGRAPVVPGAGGAAAKVDLNTATLAELDTLPGVGPVTAQAIIAWREQHGGFTSVDQLAEVDGIGPARLAKLRDAVTVG